MSPSSYSLSDPSKPENTGLGLEVVDSVVSVILMDVDESMTSSVAETNETGEVDVNSRNLVVEEESTTFGTSSFGTVSSFLSSTRSSSNVISITLFAGVVTSTLVLVVGRGRIGNLKALGFLLVISVRSGAEVTSIEVLGV